MIIFESTVQYYIYILIVLLFIKKVNYWYTVWKCLRSITNAKKIDIFVVGVSKIYIDLFTTWSHIKIPKQKRGQPYYFFTAKKSKCNVTHFI